MYRPRWYRSLSGSWSNAPQGVVQIPMEWKHAHMRVREPTMPEDVLRLAQEEYDRQHPGQPYERMQERGGLGVVEVIALLADAIERERLRDRPAKAMDHSQDWQD